MDVKQRLLFVVTEDWYFVSHRLDLACAARDAGFEVALATRVDKDAARIESEGICLFPLRYLRRSSMQPWREAFAIRELTTLYREWQPRIVHHVAAKPVIYGGLAALRARVPAVVGALAGLGYVFSSTNLRARTMRPAMLAAYRAALRHPHLRLIVQNQSDEEMVIARRLIAPRSVRRIRGSGVDTSVFTPSKEPIGVPVFVLAARMLWDKGIGEFVEAARLLRARGLSARFVLVGDTDSENPAAIPPMQLQRWQAEGLVEWWGHRLDMPDVLRTAHVVCLPSYREGLPKVLLEAAACGRPMIAADVPGCREIAIHNETALLIPPRDPARLSEAIEQLATDRDLRERLGRRARELVCSIFAIEHVNAQTLTVYRELLNECAR